MAPENRPKLPEKRTTKGFNHHFFRGLLLLDLGNVSGQFIINP